MNTKQARNMHISFILIAKQVIHFDNTEDHLRYLENHLMLLSPETRCTPVASGSISSTIFRPISIKIQRTGKHRRENGRSTKRREKARREYIQRYDRSFHRISLLLENQTKKRKKKKRLPDPTTKTIAPPFWNISFL